MMAREMELGGFRAAPVLSNALFNDWFVAHEYEPFEGMQYPDFANPTKAFLDRFYRAVELTLTVTLSAKGYWDAANFIHIQSHHESLMMEVNRIARSDHLRGIVISAHFGLRKIIRITREQLAKLDRQTRRSLYMQNTQEREHRDFTLLDDIAELIYDAIGTIANEFRKAPSDPFWTFALDVIGDMFPKYGNPPRGMDPLQQRVAIKILDKLDDNMTGWYPSMSRVVLAIIGPYDKHSNLDEGCAFRLLERAVYFRLKKLPKLADKNAEKYRDFLPDNVRLDTKTSRLIHTYALGGEESTDLSGLEIEAVSLAVGDVAM
jgi:hypothetical protein